MNKAPFHSDLAEAPDGVYCVWRKASDGVRLRVAYWMPEATNGTILLFPGRTEYLEKYGRIAGEFTRAGFAMASIDWRGQGLSDRVADDARVGHVMDFADYQRDVASLVELAEEENLPKPWFLIGHSMGGCIGLRALTNGLAAKRAVFSAPMWGIQLPAIVRPLAYILPPMARAIRQEARFAPGTRPANYVADTGFETNSLTSDPATYAWLESHAIAVPEFALGGPSVQWVGAATLEGDRLAALPRPKVPTLTFLGTEEAIVSADAIRKIHANWPEAQLRMVAGGKHEVMMETDPARQRFLDETLDFFRRN